MATNMQSTKTQHQRDAEYFLENILSRRHWTVDTRDNIAAALERVARGERLRRAGRRKGS